MSAVDPTEKELVVAEDGSIPALNLLRFCRGTEGRDRHYASGQPRRLSPGAARTSVAQDQPVPP